MRLNSLLILAILLAAEASANYYFFRANKSDNSDTPVICHNFYFSRLIIKILDRPNSLIALVPKSHKYLGVYDQYTNHKWLKFYFTGFLSKFIVHPNQALVVNETDLAITTPQGFAAISELNPNVLYEQKKPANIFRVIVMGGSTVFGFGTRLPSQSLPAQVLAKLNKLYPQKNIEVINAGFPGANSAEGYLYLESTLIAYAPDLVIAYGGWNDIWSNHKILSNNETLSPISLAHVNSQNLNLQIQSTLSTSGSFENLIYNMFNDVNSLLSQSALYYLITNRLAKLSKWINTEKVTVEPDLHPGAIEMYEQNLLRIIDTSMRNHIKLALFLQPLLTYKEAPHSPPQINPKQQIKYFLTWRKRNTQFYNKAELLFDSLAKRYKNNKRICIQSLTDSFLDTTETVYTYTGHLNSLGNKIMADKITAKLANCGLL
jgi:lysophospholipase L1-like esterase